MLNFLRFSAYSLILVFFGAFMQYRFDFLGLGVYITIGQYNIVPPGHPIPPPPTQQKHIPHDGTYRFQGEI